MDFSKAFSCLARQLILMKMKANGLTLEYACLVKNYLTDCKEKVKISCHSDWLNSIKDVLAYCRHTRGARMTNTSNCSSCVEPIHHWRNRVLIKLTGYTPCYVPAFKGNKGNTIHYISCVELNVFIVLHAYMVSAQVLGQIGAIFFKLLVLVSK